MGDVENICAAAGLTWAETLWEADWSASYEGWRTALLALPPSVQVEIDRLWDAAR